MLHLPLVTVAITARFHRAPRFCQPRGTVTISHALSAEGQLRIKSLLRAKHNSCSKSSDDETGQNVFHLRTGLGSGPPEGRGQGDTKHIDVQCLGGGMSEAQTTCRQVHIKVSIMLDLLSKQPFILTLAIFQTPEETVPAQRCIPSNRPATRRPTRSRRQVQDPDGCQHCINAARISGAKSFRAKTHAEVPK